MSMREQPYWSESTVVQRGWAYMETMTQGSAASGTNCSKSGARRLMPRMTPSTGRTDIERTAPASDQFSPLLTSMSVTAYPCSRAAAATPSSIVRLPTSVTSLTHRPTERYLPPRSDLPA